MKNQDKALDFYTKMFGFEKRADYAGPEGRFLTIAFRNQQSEVLLWPGTQGRASDSAGSPRLRSQGVSFVEAEPEEYPFGMRVTALDPDGNRVSLRQRRT